MSRNRKALDDAPSGRFERRLDRRARRHAATLERLLRTAMRLFGERGFAATTIKDITEAADVGKGTFFSYFPTKEHVFLAFGESQLARLQAGVETYKSGHVPFGQAVRALAHSLAEEPGRTPRLIRSMLIAVLSGESVRKFAAEHQGRVRAQIAEFVSIAQARGEIETDLSPQELARIFHQGIFGMFALWSMDPQVEISDWLDKWISLFLRGVELPANGRSRRAARRRHRMRPRVARN